MKYRNNKHAQHLKRLTQEAGKIDHWPLEQTTAMAAQTGVEHFCQRPVLTSIPTIDFRTGCRTCGQCTATESDVSINFSEVAQLLHIFTQTMPVHSSTLLVED